MIKLHIYLLIAALLVGTSATALEVTCKSDTGSCTVRESSGRCSCVYFSEGAGWSDGYNPDAEPKPDPTEAQLLERCEEALKESCGTEIPNPKETCTPDALEFCTWWVPKMWLFEKSCEDVATVKPVAINSDGEVEEYVPQKDFVDEVEEDSPVEPGEPNPGDVVGCCEAFIPNPEAQEAFIDCIEPLSEDDCAGYQECLDDAEETAQNNSSSSEESGSAFFNPGSSATTPPPESSGEQETDDDQKTSASDDLAAQDSDEDDKKDDGCSTVSLGKETSNPLLHLVFLLLDLS